MSARVRYCLVNTRVGLLLLSVVCGVCGIGVHFGGEPDNVAMGIAFRLLYMGAMAPAAFTVSCFTAKWLLILVQHIVMPDALFSMKDMAGGCACLATALSLMVLMQALFDNRTSRVLCGASRLHVCNSRELAHARYILWSVVMCAVIAASVTIVKTAVAKAVFARYYGAKQYRKMQLVLEQDDVIRLLLDAAAHQDAGTPAPSVHVVLGHPTLLGTMKLGGGGTRKTLLTTIGCHTRFDTVTNDGAGGGLAVIPSPQSLFTLQMQAQAVAAQTQAAQHAGNMPASRNDTVLSTMSSPFGTSSYTLDAAAPSAMPDEPSCWQLLCALVLGWVDAFMGLRAEVMRNTHHLLRTQCLLRGKGKEFKEDYMAQAAVIARLLWRALANADGAVTVTRVQELLQLDNERQARHVLDILDANSDGTLTQIDIERIIINIFTQRANMAATLEDIDSVAFTLEMCVAIGLHALLTPAYLAVWHVDFARFATTLGAILVAGAFMIGDSLRSAFEGIVFMFVQCNYQVGDVLRLEEPDGLCRVKSMTLTYTELQRDSGERVRIPAKIMAQQGVRNWSHMTSYTDSVYLDIDSDVFDPDVLQGAVEDLAQHVQLYVPDVRSRSISTDCVTLTSSPLKVRVEFKWTYAFGPDDVPRYQDARSAMIAALHATAQRRNLRCTKSLTVVSNAPNQPLGTESHTPP